MDEFDRALEDFLFGKSTPRNSLSFEKLAHDEISLRTSFSSDDIKILKELIKDIKPSFEFDKDDFLRYNIYKFCFAYELLYRLNIVVQSKSKFGIIKHEVVKQDVEKITPLQDFELIFSDNKRDKVTLNMIKQDEIKKVVNLKGYNEQAVVFVKLNEYLTLLSDLYYKLFNLLPETEKGRNFNVDYYYGIMKTTYFRNIRAIYNMIYFFENILEGKFEVKKNIETDEQKPPDYIDEQTKKLDDLRSKIFG
jgi:hypothetical protein